MNIGRYYKTIRGEVFYQKSARESSTNTWVLCRRLNERRLSDKISSKLIVLSCRPQPLETEVSASQTNTALTSLVIQHLNALGTPTMSDCNTNTQTAASSRDFQEQDGTWSHKT